MFTQLWSLCALFQYAKKDARRANPLPNLKRLYRLFFGRSSYQNCPLKNYKLSLIKRRQVGIDVEAAVTLYCTYLIHFVVLGILLRQFNLKRSWSENLRAFFWFSLASRKRSFWWLQTKVDAIAKCSHLLNRFCAFVMQATAARLNVAWENAKRTVTIFQLMFGNKQKHRPRK